MSVCTDHAFTFGRNTLVIGDSYTDMLLQEQEQELTLRVQEYDTPNAPQGHKTLLVQYHSEDDEMPPEQHAINTSLARWLLRELHNSLRSEGGNGLIMTPLETSAGDSLRLYVPDASYGVVQRHINNTLQELSSFYTAMQREMGQRFVINIGRQSPAFRHLYLRIEQVLDAFSHLAIAEHT